MSDWPDDWFRQAPQSGASQGGNGPAAAEGVASQGSIKSPGAGADPTVQVNSRSAAQEKAPPLGHSEADRVTTPGAVGQHSPVQGGWPDQPAARTPGRALGRLDGHGGGGYGGAPGLGWRRWLRPRPIMAAVAVLLSLLIIGGVSTYFYLDSKLTRKNILVNYQGRPAAGSGQNWLITGSDSRQGLSRAQERKLATGRDVSGRRSDTILVLHLPSNGGRPVLISLPRDSYVPIPGHGSDKINAAYAIGGPRLLAETVQNVTGLRIEHYMGIGFGGFVRVVNAVGGVRLCLKAPLVDPKAGLHLHKGCQVLNGAESLGYVRSREKFRTQDLQRIQDQRIFLGALLRKLTSAGVIANPFAALPAASNVAGSLIVDKSTHLYQLLKIALALRHPITTTVPISNSNYYTPSGQDAVLWNQSEARKLFGELNNGQPISKNLITGSKQQAG